MKKILLIVTAVLLLGIGVSGASGFLAAVANQGTVSIVGTDDADIALAIAENDIAEDVLHYITGGGANTGIRFDFNEMQPNSVYMYQDVLEITNNKTFDVEVGALVSDSDLIMAIAVARADEIQMPPQPPYVTWQGYMPDTIDFYVWNLVSSWARNGVCAYYNGANFVWQNIPLAAGETKYVSFIFLNPSTSRIGMRNLNIVFTAQQDLTPLTPHP